MASHRGLGFIDVVLTTDQFIAGATVVNTLILVVAAVYAGMQVRASRQSTEAQMRPWVIVDLDLLGRPPIMTLYVENIGRTAARDVTMVFDPPLRSSLDNDDRKLADLPLLTRPIESLPPGKRIETFFHSSLERVEADLDDAYRVTLQYSGRSHGSGR